MYEIVSSEVSHFVVKVRVSWWSGGLKLLETHHCFSLIQVWLIRSVSRKAPVMTVWVLSAGESFLFKITCWPPWSEYSSHLIQSALFQLQIFCSVRNSLYVWYIVIPELTSQSAVLLLQGWGARQGVRGCGGCRHGGPGGESGRTRWGVFTSVSINLNIDKQLVLLHTPEGNKRPLA